MSNEFNLQTIKNILNNFRFLWYSWKWANTVIFELVPSIKSYRCMMNFCSTLTEKLKSIWKTLHGFGGRWHDITEWHLYGSLTVFQESSLDPCSTLEHQTCSTNQSQHDLLYGGVSLSISLNLKLAPVPYATPKWPMSSWSGVLYCRACSEQCVSILFEEKHWPSLFLPQTWMGIIIFN